MSRPIGSQDKSYKDVLDEQALVEFLLSMRDFDAAFCKAMNDSVDFTLRLEVRGDKGKLLHCRVDTDSFRRPKTAVGMNTQRTERQR